MGTLIRFLKCWTVAIPIALALVIAGCTPAPAPLPGSEWALTALHGAAPAEGSHITLAFEEERFGGFAGCNGYGGPYSTGRRGTLSTPMIEQQQQLCEEPPGVMDQEEAYIGALTQAAAYRITDDQLEILDGTGAVTLAFARVPALEMDPDELVGTAWQLTALDGLPPATGSQITIAFVPGQAHGLAGCRGYRATYEASADAFHVTFLEMLDTEASCPEVLALQEGRYTTMLSWVRGYRLIEGRLELGTTRGEVLTFEPLGEDASP